MLSQKSVIILKQLYENQQAYLTSQAFADKLNVSDRTARKYVHLLLDEVVKHQGKIEVKRGQGYRLIVKDEVTFQTFYQKEVLSLITNKNLEAIHESKDRQYYMLHRLFFEQKTLSVSQVSEKLFVSRSTVLTDLNEIKKLLTPYQITLNTQSNAEITINGSEQSFRHFMMNYFFMTRLSDNLYSFSMYSNLLSDISIEEIVMIVLDESREARLQISDFIIFNMVLHIGLAIQRLKSGFEIKQENELLINKDTLEYRTALRMIRRLEYSLKMIIPKEEAVNLALHLQSKTTSKFLMKELPYDESQIKDQLKVVLNKIALKTGYQILTDKILIDGLMLHFTPLLLRLMSKRSIENPLLEKIKEKYGDLLGMTQAYFSEMPIFQMYDVTESEWAYITIHLAAAIERFINQQKSRILVICATGLGSSQMLKARLENELGTKIVIQRVIGYYELTQESLVDIDLIVSSIALPKFLHQTPIVHVSVFLDEDDIRTIHHELAKLSNDSLVLAESYSKKGEVVLNAHQELIKNCFNQHLFIRYSEKETKEQVLADLISGIELLENQPVKNDLKKQLKLRETYSGVAFSTYLAVPHPIEAVTSEAYVAVAICPKGIDWDAEHKNIQLVFLLSPDRLGIVPLEKISLMLVPIIENDKWRQSLVACQSYESFVELFSQGLEN